MQPGMLLPEPAGGLRRHRFSPGKLSKAFDQAGHIIQMARLRGKNRKAEVMQARHLPGRIATLPGYDEIGTKRDDGLQIEAEAAANAGNAFGVFGIITVLDCTADVPTRSGRKQQFRRVRRQTDNTARGLIENNGLPGIIPDADFHRRYVRCHCAAYESERYPTNRLDHSDIPGTDFSNRTPSPPPPPPPPP